MILSQGGGLCWPFSKCFTQWLISRACVTNTDFTVIKVLSIAYKYHGLEKNCSLGARVERVGALEIWLVIGICMKGKVLILGKKCRSSKHQRAWPALGRHIIPRRWAGGQKAAVSMRGTGSWLWEPQGRTATCLCDCLQWQFSKPWEG